MLRQAFDHQSALHILCKAEQQKKLPVPFAHIETSIRLLNSKLIKRSEQDGIYPGDTVVLTGKSGTGKTFILSRFMSVAVSEVVYIDLEHGTTGAHLFQPRTDRDLLHLIHGLEKWFYDESQRRIGWVMIDGEWPDPALKWKLVEKLKDLQYHWPFVLLYTSRTLVKNPTDDNCYRFECYKQDQTVCMKLIPPFSACHRYTADDLVAMVTKID